MNGQAPEICVRKTRTPNPASGDFKIAEAHMSGNGAARSESSEAPASKIWRGVDQVVDRREGRGDATGTHDELPTAADDGSKLEGEIRVDTFECLRELA